MTQVNAYEGLGLAAPVVDDSARSELGQEDFMTLMMAQFRNQDPFEPMDNGDFLGQLAQFGTVSGIESLNSSFTGLQGSIQSEQALQAANLVGHRVLAETDRGYLQSGGKLFGGLELDASASNVQVEITDASGQLVRRFDLGQQPAGQVAFSWDGLDAEGNEVASGQYFVSARAARGTQVESVSTLLEARIESVTLGRAGEGLTLNTGGGTELSLASVRQII